ncbi:hypothetical protein A3H65_04330 [Candidatus Giovannonibacteria bacterium RIFCSPLOWO2_02_FULL_45_14]|uniref:DUF3784 domain-containing protein n=1 Tax=Candidatus Giovannonibacteria bacterium RIFCSPLOWO2_12_FULL_44_15 TaxID=1798364 RepID=A0A1F5XYL1_9BACT|nr:MAG: hypothetical protein A3C75_00415 [Candidatus Giovannonibacteria bacterium RIFCSPHIGHO2_02_FULL_44_31]OGF76771.1 MAG: hypothetical protein A3E62_00955 [Candidatus Giovannonibacteria bacterium RIFCSPHIGHO2_12_FULL_44_29]OGF91056.1 MAG: hypothetical protein A3H65_04330 [Candidatus Giovannonibacteria bacterium RIFCSPLOWO2_02_FULL_45_14]OGF92978.1 MAG: hypothetical protein A3G54_01885 [Candidatus Giovannonibacteria bacterium RIFCSPLOWO2_12_FULL_44_15]
MNWFRLILGSLGFALIINSIAIVLSSKYYSLFSKVYFIEPASEKGREKAKKNIETEKNAQRYGLSVICIGLGLTAMLWSLSVVESITFPFLILAVTAFVASYFGIFKNH